MDLKSSSSLRESAGHMQVTGSRVGVLTPRPQHLLAAAACRDTDTQSGAWAHSQESLRAAFTWEPSALDLHHLSGSSGFQISCFNDKIHFREQTGPH